MRELLLVEDRAEDVELALMALRMVEDAPRVHVARDGDAAIALLADEAIRERLAVVLLDLNLPGIDGFGVLAHMRTTPCLRALPVVVLSTSGSSVDVERAYELGANAYVAKPMRFDAFVETMAGLARFWLQTNRV